MSLFGTIRGLSEIIFGSIGVAPLPTPLGLITEGFKLLYDMSIRDGDGKMSHQSIYMAETVDPSGNLLVAITISKDNKEDDVLVCKVNDSIVGIKFNWNDSNNCGTYFKLNEEKWLPASMLDKLIIATVFQSVSQNGYAWNPLGDNKEMYKYLVSLVELES